MRGDLAELEAESIYIIREAAGDFERPVLLYSIGKDSSVLLRLAQKAFAPAPVPFPLLHIDTGYKFNEMLEFRDRICAEAGLRLLVRSNWDARRAGANPFELGNSRCCALLKTKALLDALSEIRADAAIGGARRDEERSRAKERVYSLRSPAGQWDPRGQRPELWSIYNGRLRPGESMRIFPLSNWTELDIWRYVAIEQIPVVPLYFARPRRVVVRGNYLIPIEHEPPLAPTDVVREVWCRMRTLGCTYCTGAVRSRATTIDGIIRELGRARRSERENRLIDHDVDGSMEIKKREGYF